MRGVRGSVGAAGSGAVVEGAGGAMGGNVSHEWQLDANGEGQDSLRLCRSCGAWRNAEIESCSSCSTNKPGLPDETIEGQLEVGHTFQLGDRYSAPRLMNCFGLGLSRLLAALAVAPRWPEELAVTGTILLLPPRNSQLPSAKVLDHLLSECSSHQHVLVWDDPAPRVSLAQRLARARLLRPPRIRQLVKNGSRLLDEEGNVINQF